MKINVKNIFDCSYILVWCSLLIAVSTFSESVIELLALMKRTLSEAEQNGEDIQARLHHACRSIIDLYMSVLPTAHRNALENIPRHSALAYNNCMYLGHVLLTLEVLTVNSSKLFFVLDAQNLRQLGANLFLEQMKLQRTYLTNIIKEAGELFVFLFFFFLYVELDPHSFRKGS